MDLGPTEIVPAAALLGFWLGFGRSTLVWCWERVRMKPRRHLRLVRSDHE